MTIEKTKGEKEAYISSRAWAEECINTVKRMQDDFLDRYKDDKEGSTAILKLLTQLVAQLEKRL
jgi:hypothetical protein